VSPKPLSKTRYKVGVFKGGGKLFEWLSCGRKGGTANGIERHLPSGFKKKTIKKGKEKKEEERGSDDTDRQNEIRRKSRGAARKKTKNSHKHRSHLGVKKEVTGTGGSTGAWSRNEENIIENASKKKGPLPSKIPKG